MFLCQRGSLLRSPFETHVSGPYRPAIKKRVTKWVAFWLRPGSSDKWFMTTVLRFAHETLPRQVPKMTPLGRCFWAQFYKVPALCDKTGIQNLPILGRHVLMKKGSSNDSRNWGPIWPWMPTSVPKALQKGLQNEVLNWVSNKKIKKKLKNQK